MTSKSISYKSNVVILHNQFNKSFGYITNFLLFAIIRVSLLFFFSKTYIYIYTYHCIAFHGKSILANALMGYIIKMIGGQLLSRYKMFKYQDV